MKTTDSHTSPILSGRLPARFRFQGARLFLAAMTLILGMMAFLLFLLEHNRSGALRAADLLCWAFFLFFFIGIAAAALASADILVEDQGLSRCILGWRIQAIRWDNVKLIKTRINARYGRGKANRTISIYPLIKPKVRWPYTGKMFFGERIERADELIKIINTFASIHSIKLQAENNGSVSFVEAL